MGEPAMMWCCVWLCQCSACLLCEGWALLGFFFIFAEELLSTDSPSALPPALILPSLSRSPCWEFGSSSDSALVVLVLSVSLACGSLGLRTPSSPGSAAIQAPVPVSTPKPWQPGAAPILHCHVLLTHLGQIPVNWCSAEPWGAGGRRRGPSSREEEGEGVRKSYGGEGG